MTIGGAPRRVVLLGGGIASLATAWRLSEDEAVESITVYQRGWRLGGRERAVAARTVGSKSTGSMYGFATTTMPSA